jgi:hypothetical protein
MFGGNGREGFGEGVTLGKKRKESPNPRDPQGPGKKARTAARTETEPVPLEVIGPEMIPR